MADSKNPNEPQKLEDVDLAEVSGGAIPEEILALVDLLPDERDRRFIMKFYPNDEKRFMQALYSEMKTAHKREGMSLIRDYCLGKGIKILI